MHPGSSTTLSTGPCKLHSKGASLRKSAVSSSLWTLTGFGIAQALRLVSNIVLAALLFEEAFALMAVVLAISQGLAMFSDFGLGPSIVQNPRGDDRRFLDTAWTIQLIRGLALCVILVFLSYPLAAFYAANDPMAWELRGLMLVMALSAFIQGFQSTKVLTASRHLNIGRVTILQVSAQIVGIVVSIFIAWKTQSVYSLAWGTLTSVILTSTISHVLPGEKRNRIHWDIAAVREIVKFGKWILLSTAITFFAIQLDKLVFSRLFPLDQVGVYAIAVNISILAPMLMGRLIFAVAFPVFSRVIERSGDLAKAANEAKGYLLTIGAFLTAGLVGCGEAFINLAYDSRYTEAGLYLPILAVGAWFTVLENTYGAALLAKGKANWTAATNAAKVLSFCLLLAPAVYLGGILGAVIAVAISEFFKMIVALVGARRIGLRNIKRDAFFTLHWGSVVLVTWLVTGYVQDFVELTRLQVFLLQVTLTILAFAPSTWRAMLSIRARSRSS